MGMFDYIVCELDLPGTVPEFVRSGNAEFQTKDTPPQHMETHTIAADGAFSIPDFTGDVVFYTSNIVGCGPGVYTRNGEDAESVEFKATIVKGKCVGLEQTEYEIKAALPSREQGDGLRDQHEILNRLWKEPPADGSWMGRRVYMHHGGQERGYYVDVVAEGERKIVVKLGDDYPYKYMEFHDEYKSGFGHTLFLCEDDAMAYKTARSSAWEARKREYDNYAAKWQANRATA